MYKTVVALHDVAPHQVAQDVWIGQQRVELPFRQRRERCVGWGLGTELPATVTLYPDEKNVRLDDNADRWAEYGTKTAETIQDMAPGAELWLGTPGSVTELASLTPWGMHLWWTWKDAQQLPLPPHAYRVTQEIQSALLKQTTYLSPAAPDHVRAFYRQQLLARGWQYCGTQETPGCTNLLSPNDGSGALVDVYRPANNRDKVAPSIEIKPVVNAHGQTYVVIWQANRYPRVWQ